MFTDDINTIKACDEARNNIIVHFSLTFCNVNDNNVWPQHNSDLSFFHEEQEMSILD